MAHLWFHLPDKTYGIALLNGTVFGFTDDPESPVLREDSLSRPVRLMRYGVAPDAKWILLARRSAGVLVNGNRLCGGLKVLTDRDEIRACGGARSFFSEEELAHVERYPGGAESARCPRCQDPIQRGSESVRCPSCGIWHHQYTSDEEQRRCWSHAAGCAVCGQATDFDSGYRWTPADL